MEKVTAWISIFIGVMAIIDGIFNTGDAFTLLGGMLFAYNGYVILRLVEDKNA